MGLGFRAWGLGSTHRLHSSSFLWFVFGILESNPEKQLLWSLWAGFRAPETRNAYA